MADFAISRNSCYDSMLIVKLIFYVPENCPSLTLFAWQKALAPKDFVLLETGGGSGR